MGEKKRREKNGTYRVPARPTMCVLRDESAAEMQRYTDAANAEMEAAIAGGYNTHEWIRERFAESDIVFGIYPDPTERYGVGVAILRGMGRLHLVSQGKKDVALKAFHLRCTDKMHAEAYCLALGDGRQELGEEVHDEDGDLQPVAMRILRNLSLTQREDYARKANKAEDEAIAAGKDPNKWLQSSFAIADVVFGVWQDPAEPGDIGVAILKGTGVMQRISSTGKAEAVAQTFVRCASAYQAEAMCRTFGDASGTAAGAPA